MKTISTNKQSGAVSLFVVIFFMLLATVVTVSFLRIMVADQQQASDNDLSQSAYDSAQAGVEDAKRVLLNYQQVCNTATNSSTCPNAAAAISTDVCNAAINELNGALPGDADVGKEIQVQQTTSVNDAKLNQAYTCVTIKLKTDDYEGTLSSDESQFVPLVSSENYDRVQIEWFDQDDIGGAASPSALNLTGVGPDGQPLYAQGSWPAKRPSLLRSQLIQFDGSSFTLGSFDIANAGQSNTATMFLYPVSTSGNVNKSFIEDVRKSSPTTDPVPKTQAITPYPTTCATSVPAGGYACKAVITLPPTIGGATDSDVRSAFLNLTSLYHGSHFKVTLWKGDPSLPSSTKALFNGIQPQIDSTGKANDLYRRVQSRVNLYDTSFPYPDAAVSVTNNFCKDFAVTNTAYIDAGRCIP